MIRARRSAWAGLHAVLATLVALLAIGCSSDERWNVLLITLDTTRADYLGCYGRAGDPTPRLDALAAEGTRFDLAFATAAVTPVSHASILTGLDNKQHGVRVISAAGGYRLPRSVPMLSGVLKSQGYRTGAVHSAFPVSAHFGFDRDFDVFESFDAKVPEGESSLKQFVGLYQRRSDETTDLALDFVGKGDDPFFLWVHYWDPHDNVRLPPAEFLTGDVPRLADGTVPPSRELYAAEVRYQDQQIGRLLDGLRERGELDRTIVVVVSDHGEGLGDHGWDHHRILYQEQMRVPLIVRVPGVEQTPSSSAVVRATDIYPTVIDYLGIEAPAPVDGVSLRNLIEGKPDAPRTAFADQVNGYDLNATMVRRRPLDDFLYCVVDRGWKLIYRPNHPERSELYDLATDPREQRDLFAAQRDQAVRLKLLLAEHAPWVTAPFAGEADADASAALGTLGYTGDDGEAVDANWAWTCPEHDELLFAERQRCPQCKSAPLLVRRR